MFCENCGKSIIRGYNFCLECGTPVPPENAEPEQQGEAAAEEQGMPQIEPLFNEGETLVFCTNCGMHMQTGTAYCEKCGQQLQAGGNSGGDYSNLPKNGSVPLWNTESYDYGYETMSEGEIEQINNFMNGGGVAESDNYDDYNEIGTNDTFGGYVGGADGSSMADISDPAAQIEALTAQFANMVAASTNSEMPTINTYERGMEGDTVKVENFAMDTSYVDDEYVDTGALPVIEGASMEYDPDEPEPEDPNAFEMTPEPIAAITPTHVPAYEEPVADVPTYEEPVAEAPAYEEPVAEVPTYEEPVADVPVYEEPVAEVPAYEEPVAEVPAYEEPVAEDTAYAIPLYGTDDSATYTQAAEPEYPSDIPLFGAEEAPEYPVYNAPTYEEPVAEIPTYEEPTVEIPTYEEAVAAIPTYEEPAVEAPAYEEPAAEVPTYEEPIATIPTYEESVAAAPTYEQPAIEESSDDNAAIGIAGAAIGAAAAYGMADSVADSAQPADYSAPAADYSQSYNDNYNNSYSSSTVTSVAEEAEAEKPDLGRLLYCRKCGQDMYELETVCKYCGSAKLPEYQPPRVRQGKAKGEPFKLFGIFSIPALIVTAVVVVGIVALIIPSLNKDDEIVDSTPKPSTTTSATTSDAAGGDVDTQSTTAPVEDKVPDDTTATSTAAATSAPTEVSAEAPDSNDGNNGNESSEPAQSEASTPASSTPASSTPASSPASSSSVSSVTTTKTTTTTPQQSTGAYTPSATIKSQNKERDKMIDAYELMAEEMGKIDLLARTTSYAIMFDSRDADTAGKSFYSRDIAAAMLKNIKNGKASVASAVSAAKPSTSELNKAYKALCALEDKYIAYLDYVINATKFSNYESKCDTHMSGFASYAASNFTLSAMATSAQTSTDKAEYYASVASNAVAAAENAASAYSTLRSKVAALTDTTFEGQFLTVMNDNISTYLKAAKYTQAVSAYCDILSSAPSAYSTAYSGIKTARDNLTNLADMFALAQYDNTLANFKSSTNSYISSATSGASKAKNAL